MTRIIKQKSTAFNSVHSTKEKLMHV